MNKQAKHTRNRRKPNAFKLIRLSLFTLTVIIMGGCGNSDSEKQSTNDEKTVTSQSGDAENSAENQAGESNVPEMVVTPKATSEDWNLILVNRDHLLGEEIEMELYMTDNGYPIDNRIKDSYVSMIEAGHAAGLDFSLVSGYRSIENQQINYDVSYNNYIAQGYLPEEAKAKTEEFIALPNASEHTTGLAVDITSTTLANEAGNSGLFQDLENYPEGKWLKENAPSFGFILRYPKDKEEITGIKFEPWHFRYVGVENAQYITEKNLSLEEYVEILKQNEAIFE